MSRTRPEFPGTRPQHTMLSAADVHHVLQLYITGPTPRCIRALSNIRAICETYLLGRYELEVVDMSSQPGVAADAQIFAAPTLIRKHPLPLRRFIGDMSETDRILAGLGIRGNVAPHATSGRG